MTNALTTVTTTYGDYQSLVEMEDRFKEVKKVLRSGLSSDMDHYKQTNQTVMVVDVEKLIEGAILATGYVHRPEMGHIQRIITPGAVQQDNQTIAELLEREAEYKKRIQELENTGHGALKEQIKSLKEKNAAQKKRLQALEEQLGRVEYAVTTKVGSKGTAFTVDAREIVQVAGYLVGQQSKIIARNATALEEVKHG